MTARVSILLKSCASPDMLPFSLCNKKKTCNSANEQILLSNDTTDFVLRQQELGRAKDLSAPHRAWHARSSVMRHLAAAAFWPPPQPMNYSAINVGGAPTVEASVAV
jgi:hypothetical protein